MSAVKLAESDEDIRRCHPLMRMLRDALPDEDGFVAQVQRQRATQPGWRLAYVADVAGDVVGLAGFRVFENLAWGRTLYVDDLIVRADQRGTGLGKLQMAWVEGIARAEGCAQLHLDSGTQRHRAHRFYHGVGLSISSFHFGRKL